MRLYRGLLWLYPVEFRDHFSREVCLLLADSLESRTNNLQRFAVWLAAAGAVLVDAPREHCHMIRQDITYALRTMRREKLTSLIAVLVLALGIGSAATIFKLVNGLLLHPLPFPHQERLLYVEEATGAAGPINGQIAYPNYLDFCARNRTLDSFALYGSGLVTIRQEGMDAERTRAGSGTGPLFRVLGVQPLMGRTFNDADDQPNAPPVVVISEDLWRSRFGADPNILSKTITLGIAPHQIIGVMPRSFRFPDDSRMWLPLQLDPKENTRMDHSVQGVARLSSGATGEQAQSDLRGIMRQITREHPSETYGQTVNVRPFQQQTVGDAQPLLLTLLGAVGCVLLIACANISSLLLVRATSRQREIAVRGALGASRSRVIRQFVVESALLSFAGAAAGLLLAWIAVPALVGLTPANTLPVWANFSNDLRSWAFIAVVTSGVGILVSILPALSTYRLNLVDALKEGGRSNTAGAPGNRVRSILVVSEVALSVLLLTGAGLMIRTFENLRNQNTGFHTDNITTLQTAAPSSRYPNGPAAEQLVQQIRSALSALPGVISVAATSGVPIADSWGRSLTVEDAPLLGLKDAPMINHTIVTPGYFKTIGLPIVDGRDFNDSDGAKPLVTIVDASIARKYWPQGSAIGKRVRYGPPEANEAWHTIVGVAADARNQNLREPSRGTVYLPYGEFRWANLAWLVRTRLGLGDPAQSLRRTIVAIDRNVAVSRVTTMRQIVDDAMWEERFFATLFTFFAGLAMLMAMVGLYGVMAYTVSRRRHELGIRMALGASASGIRAMVLMQSGRLVVAGLAIGAIAALFLTRLLQKELYGVTPTDPATFLTVSALLVLAALLATYLPALRATKVDPMSALRAE